MPIAGFVPTFVVNFVILVSSNAHGFVHITNAQKVMRSVAIHGVTNLASKFCSADIPVLESVENYARDVLI